MTWSCKCAPSGKTFPIDNCDNCNIENCPPCPEGRTCDIGCISEPSESDSSTFNGFPIILFIILFVIQMALFLIMLVISIIILKKLTKQKKISQPMTIFIICILLLWILVGWYPFVGLALFIILLICILSLTSTNSKKRNTKGKSKVIIIKKY